ncbi:MAG TPA: c-type cytochrome, partial [Gemmataceae bacterium]
DFYREVIETPLSLPEDIKARVNLESRGRGRIWRIAPEDRQPARKPDLRAAKTAELVKHLADPNQWWRLTAQRLLVERKDRGAIPDLEKLAATAPAAAGRAHALWTLQGLGALKPGLIIAALKDADAGVREQALRLADLHLSGKPDAALENAVLALAGDADPRVRFQLAFTLASVSPEKAGPVLADILRREGGDRWMQTAALSSAAKAGPELLLSLLDDPKYVAKSGTGPLLTRLAAMIGASEDEQALAAVLKRLGGTERPAGWEVAVLEGLGQGLQNSKRPLARVWDNPPAGLRDAVERAVGFFRRSGEAAADAERPARERLAAVRLLGYSPAAVGVPALAGLLTPQTPADLQLAALRALGRQDDRSVADHILEGWPSYTPGLRREALEVLFARPDRLERLLEAVERKQVAASELGPDRAALLRKHPNAVLRKRAEKLLAGVGQSNRGKVVESYRAALGLKGDVARGREVFRKNCASCHRLEDVGTEVGANLLAALPNKTPEALLLDVLDPNREVDPRYLNYLVTTLNGRTYSGVLAAESPSSITLRRAEKAEDTLLRAQIDEIRSTGQSLMPEELEKQLTRQDVADVIAYLMAAARGGKEKALPPGP